ncbi:hypothetical protein ACWCYY_34850 [Kitasatospora sp. NPDC001664]
MLDQPADLPEHIVEYLLREAALRSLTDPSTKAFLARWTEERGDFESARSGSPDAVPYIAEALRWVLAARPKYAAYTYGMIAHQARHEFEIPPAFTAGWLASNIHWGGARREPLPDGVDIDAVVQAATAEEALREL